MPLKQPNENTILVTDDAGNVLTEITRQKNGGVAFEGSHGTAAFVAVEDILDLRDILYRWREFPLYDID